MSSFDEEERRRRIVVPKSTTEGKVVKLAPKNLKTHREVRTVLPEEQYLSGLEKIIVRDYFPELPKLKAQAEYMDAMSRNDIAKMRELQVRYNTSRRTDRRTSPSFRRETSPVGGANGEASPSRFDPETPGPSRLDGSPLPYANREGDNERALKKMKKKAEIEKLSIDGYLSKFTSEDNASFEELTILAAKRDKARNAWVYEAAETHNKEKVVRNAIAADADVQLALKYSAEADKEKPLELDNWEYKAKNHVLFNPDGVEMTAEEQIENFKRNQKTINKSGTRFPDDVKNKPSQSTMARAAFQHAAVNAGKVDVLGHEASLPVNTLGLVATPSPAPGVEDSPFMTWGEIDGTPFRLDVTDVPAPLENAPAFKIPDVPLREQIAQGLSDTIAKRYHDKRKIAIDAARGAHKTPKYSSVRSTERLALLSPAARRLASNKLGIRLGSSKTPTVKQSPLVSPRVGSASSSKAKTPISSMIRRSTPKTSSITDDLMPIANDVKPELKSESKSEGGGRARAGDFF